MKKIISVITTLALALSSFTVAIAADKSGMENALKTVKSRIGNTDKYTEFNSEMNDNAYQFYWSNDDEYCGVTYDDGIITSYYHDRNMRDWDPDAKFPKKNADEVKALAEEFIKKINPDIADELTVDIPSASVRGGYNIAIEHKVGGYSVFDNYGYMSFNNNFDEVTHFYLNYSKVTAPDKSEILSKEELQKAYSEKIGMHLVYEFYHDEDTQNKVYYPVYENTDYSKKIDAITGDVITPYDDLYGDEDNAGGFAEKSMASDEGFTDVENEVLESVSGLISTDEAEKIIRSNKYIKVSGMELTSHRLTRIWDNDKDYLYQMYFSGQDGKFARVTIDAKSGQILSLYQTADNSGERNTKLEKEAANAFAANEIGEYRYDDEGERFIRVENGLDVMGNDISVVAYGDTVTSYMTQYDKYAQFPKVDDVISQDEATSKMFDLSDYKILLYADKDGNTKTFFDLETYYNISPYTGKAVDYNGEELKEEENLDMSYTDMDNHWAKDIVKTLGQFGIGFYEREFKPDTHITAGDFADLLDEVFYGDIVYKYFGDSGKDFDKQANLTRMEAAVMMIKAMGADKYADFDIYISPFGDVTSNKGYVALLHAMGVVSGSNGKFRPDDLITRAEAATMLYNYLGR